MTFYISLLQILSTSDDRPRSYGVISIFTDGGHGVGNLLPGLVLVMALFWRDGNLLAYQISIRYLNPWLR